MSTNYRNHLGNYVDFDEWRNELKCPENCSHEEKIIKGEYEVIVSKLYCGTSGSLYKLIIDCSADLTGLHGYNKSFQGEASAETDYQRVITAINDDVALMADGKIIET